MGKQRNDITDEKVLKLLQSGMLAPAIAKKFGCAVYTIYKRGYSAGWVFDKKKSHVKAKTKKKRKICICCKAKPVPDRPVQGHKLTRLCRECFLYGRERGLGD